MMILEFGQVRGILQEQALNKFIHRVNRIVDNVLGFHHVDCEFGFGFGLTVSEE